jgi:hypothetical protein
MHRYTADNMKRERETATVTLRESGCWFPTLTKKSPSMTTDRVYPRAMGGSPVIVIFHHQNLTYQMAVLLPRDGVRQRRADEMRETDRNKFSESRMQGRCKQ